ncbi:serine/threonine protein kinase [Coemansia erecta]|nr:serine/threonine protein kinase [Coemansia erecta]KAJ2874615.1 serine/threonine protein kinase [Coemansia asiatica]
MQLVAVKTLQASQGAVHDPAATALGGILSRRALEELGIAVNVRHENIVRTFDVVVETDRRCYVVMEACSVDLLSMIQSHTATFGTCMDDDVLDGYFAQLVRGVQYLHSIGVAHRDLKLDNVCVTEQGIVKIVDFGCATLFRRRVHRQQQQQQQQQPRAASRARAAPYSVTRPRQQAAPVVAAADSGLYVETLSSGICGSDPYMAPELFSSSHQYLAAKVDIWALGIIYFAMRHLQFPWSVAHAARDARFRAFSDNPAMFFDTWFPDTSKSSTWSSQSRFLTTHRLTAAAAVSEPAKRERCQHQQQGEHRERGQKQWQSMRQARVIIGRILEPNPAIRTDIDGIVADEWFQLIG